MNRILRFMVLLLSLSLFASAQNIVPGSDTLFIAGNYRPQDKPAPKYEYRAVWLTTIENLDWPHTKIKNPCDVEKQKREMEVLLDSLQAMHINTVLLQVLKLMVL